MKKALSLLLCGLCLMTACSPQESDEQTIATLVPTTYQIQNTVTASSTPKANKDKEKAEGSDYDFIIERYRLKDPGSNITVDSALKLIIEKIDPAKQIKLKSGQKIAYNFQGYRLFEDGTCYMIGFGTNSVNGFKELYRFAISYNKTIYECQIKGDKEGKYKQVYSIDNDTSDSFGSIDATIRNHVLTIKDPSTNKVISTFSLSRYGLTKAETSDIMLMDMNFNGYSDVAILLTDENFHSRYYAFLYNPFTNTFKYDNSYCNLASPEFNSELNSIICSESKKGRIVIDSYSIVNNHPEIKERTSYTYKEAEKLWLMEHFEGKNGHLTQTNSQFYTSDQVSSETGEFISN